jgi:hypothetical protein
VDNPTALKARRSPHTAGFDHLTQDAASVEVFYGGEDMARGPDKIPRKRRGVAVDGGSGLAPIIVSERAAVDLFCDIGLTRDLLRTLIDRGVIFRREIVRPDGRRLVGLVYHELQAWAQALPIVPPID